MKQSWLLFWITLKHECLLVYRHLLEVTNPLLFLLIVICLFPFAVGTDLDVLRLLAPAILWITALLSIILGLDRVFRAELEEGSLEQVLLSSQSLIVIVFAKMIAQWLLTGLPITIMAVLIGGLLDLSLHTIKILFYSLLLGTPTLVFLGVFAKALTLQSRNNQLLVMILILPFYIPVLIFGASSVMLADEGFSVAAQFCWLTILLIFSVVVTPWLTASALRFGVIP